MMAHYGCHSDRHIKAAENEIWTADINLQHFLALDSQS